METGQEAETEPIAEKEPESPATYQRESESGKVKFGCKVEIPDSFTGDAVHKYLVLGQCYGDEESILSKYVEGKEILEQFSSEAHDGIPSRTYYTMADGANANIGGVGLFLEVETPFIIPMQEYMILNIRKHTARGRYLSEAVKKLLKL